MRSVNVKSHAHDAEPADILARLEPTSRRARLIRIYASTVAAITEARAAAPHLLGIIVLSLLCAGALVIGWGLVLASLLYVVAAAYSVTTWLLTALGLAIGHGVLAAACWRHAAALGRELTSPPARRGCMPPSRR